jgi:hypothetical protein
MTDEQVAALRDIVRDMGKTHLLVWIEHLYRCKAGMNMGDSSVIMLAELGCPAAHARTLIDNQMSDSLDRSARHKVAALEPK